mgnify:FL=1
MPPKIEESLEEARSCRSCHAVVNFSEPLNSEEGYKRGECVLFRCNVICKACWCYCKSCKKRFNSNNVTAHPKTNKHKINHEKLFPSQNFKKHKTNHEELYPLQNDNAKDNAPPTSPVEMFPGTDTGSVAETGPDVLMGLDIAHGA